MSDVVEGARLSPQQRRLWALREAHGPLVVQLAADLEGPLDRAALRAAVDRAVARHDILRTTFQPVPGLRVPVQVVVEDRACVWTEGDAQPGEQPDEQLDEMDRLLAEEAGALAEPVLRARLTALAPDRHLLILTLPALLGDHGTLRRLFAEIADGYAGTPPEEEPVPYWQYAEWLNDLQDEEGAAAERSYWERRLPAAGRPAPRLPFERDAEAPWRPGRLFLETEPGLLVAVRRAAQERGATLPAFLLAAWQVLLRRLTGEEELTVGVAVDGREYEELAGALGPFARALPVRARWPADARFEEIVQGAGKALAEAAQRQRFFAWEPSRAAARDLRNPPFLPFGFEHREEAPRRGVRGVAFSVRGETAPCDRSKVALVCQEGANRLTLELIWDAARLDEEEVRRLAERFQALVASAAAAPRRMAAELDLLPSDERRRLEDWGGGREAAVPDRCVHELFEEQAARTPDAPAVDFGDRKLSYRELDARANALARRLREIGVGPEERVGLSAELSPAALVGLLAILKAGGAFVPVDPNGPAERRAFLLSDAGVRVMVTSSAASPPAGFGGERIVVDLEEEPVGEAASYAHPANLAYVLYTSGSTGLPKGVGVEHRQLVSYLGFVDRVLFGEGVRSCPLVTPLTFDASLKQILAPLLRGGTVWGLSGDAAIDPAALVAELARRQEVALNGTPTLWRALLEEIERSGSAGSLSGLKRLLLGGERLNPELLERTASVLPGVEVWNLYGPTEATANATFARLAPGEPVTLGRPIDGARVRLLDRALQPVPPGVAGEIWIGGSGVARGYLGRPGLTAERFLPDAGGERLYRTGDLGRFTAGGEIEFLGRIDHQVKIRGFRIELGEIEARLELHPGVREAAVVLRDEPGNPRLAAFVVPEKRSSPGAAELRASLREMLPEYMIPSAFVVLERLPRLSSGKVDRASLPDTVESAASERPFVAPRTATERRLAEIWAEVLGRESVGVEDNFFELGGHSIQSIQISHRANAAGLVLTPRDLLQHPTIAGLAALAEAAAPPLPPLAADAPDWEEGSL